MKKAILFALVPVLILSLAACRSNHHADTPHLADADTTLPNISYSDNTEIFDDILPIDYSFEGTNFCYGEQRFDLTLRCPSINAITSATPVGQHIVIECHVGPKNNVYCIFDTTKLDFDADIFG